MVFLNFSRETRSSTRKTGKSICKSNAQRRHSDCKHHAISTLTVDNLSTICRQSVDNLSIICRHYIGKLYSNSTPILYTLSTICILIFDNRLLKSHLFKGDLVFLLGRLELFLHGRFIRGRKGILAGCWRRLNPGTGAIIFTGLTAWLIGRSRPARLLAF